MQRLLNHAVWDHEQAMRVVREFVAEHLAEPGAVVVLDESGQEKGGVCTAGVKRQYVGCAGKIANAVNVVYATLASGRGHATVAARPYLPQEWADDPDRRAAAGVPEQVEFRTKPELAVQILAELHAEARLPLWCTADEVYCATRRLVVSPAQPGGTRREVSGSDGLPGTERIRGQEHARKATVVFRRRSGALRDPRDMAKAGLPEP
jgi:SRSO17 transposase